MKILCVVLLVVALVVPASAQPVTFTCTITGSHHDGFDLVAINPGPQQKKCSATCTVTRSDGTTQSWSYSRTVRSGTPKNGFWFAGEAGLKGAPLRNPTVSKSSCE